MKNKYLEKLEWSMGNGQCPECCGNKPNHGWWTEFIGHKAGCPLAELIVEMGMTTTYEMLNPERAIGHYILGRKGNGLLCMIRNNDPDKERKLALSKK